MTDGQIDQLWNLINALNDRIADLERETADLRFRADNAENQIDRLYWVDNAESAIENLQWRNDNGY